MTAEEAVKKLDAIDHRDCEAAHGTADGILAEVVPVEVRDAYDRLRERCSWWAHA